MKQSNVLKQRLCFSSVNSKYPDVINPHLDKILVSSHIPNRDDTAFEVVAPMVSEKLNVFTSCHRQSLLQAPQE